MNAVALILQPSQVDQIHKLYLTVNPKLEHFEIVCSDEMELANQTTLEKKARSFAGRIKVTVPLESVGCTNDPSDIAADLADALYVGEELAKIFPQIDLSRGTVDYKRYIYFDLIMDQPEKQCKNLIDLLDQFYNWDIPDDKGQGYFDFLDSLFWQDDCLKLRFPEIAEDYMANLLHGSSTWEDEETLCKYRNAFPETAQYYWRSFTARQSGIEIFCSPDAWVGAPDLDIAQCLADLGFWAGPIANPMEDAKIQEVGALQPLLVSTSTAIKIPKSELARASNFSSTFFRTKSATPKNQIWEISVGGDLLVRRTEAASSAFFTRNFCLSEEERNQYASFVSNEHLRIRKALGFDISCRCDWSVLDDESFEELCYHVICRCGLFDPKTVRKMGNSRSRDGGRDITAITYPRPGSLPKVWIVQCKYSRSGRSLSGSRVEISEVIDQFGLQGFGVMTNLVIDSTLYDKIDAITKRKGIDHEEWPGMKIERFLQYNPDLVKRYFERL